MKVVKKEVWNWLECNPQYNSRKMMYLGTAKFIEQKYPKVVDAGYVQLCVLVHRRMQDCIKNDKKGEELAEKFLRDEGYKR